MSVPQRQIRAVYDDETVRVYQAYSDEIADAALRHGTFVSPPFRRERMTWIKPSFLWMMYRAGWGDKDAGQKRILAVDISRAGFEWALSNSSLSHYVAATGLSYDAWRAQLDERPVRIQWDPERDLHLSPLPHRAIQIGLRGEAVGRYVEGWIRKVSDITSLAHQVRDAALLGDLQQAAGLLPVEKPYPLSPEIARCVGATAY